MNYVYILECGDGSLYTGWTNQLEKRVKDHSSGKGAKYTRSRLPLDLVYQELCDSPTAARKREAQIKKLSRKQKLALLERQKSILALARKKLESLGQSCTRISFNREKDDIVLFRIEKNNEHYVLKLFLSDYGKEEIDFYAFLQEKGIKTLLLNASDHEALLMEDLHFSQDYSLAIKEQMCDPEVMASLGTWYRKLHLINEEEIKHLPYAKEWKSLHLEKLEEKDQIFKEDKRWKKVFPLLKELFMHIEKLPLCLCYNDFYYVNMVVGEHEAFMLDYGHMGLNYPGMDLVNALWFSNEEARKAFRESYGLHWDLEEAWVKVLLPLQDFLLHETEELLSTGYLRGLRSLLKELNSKTK